MSPKTIPKAERPSADTLATFAGRVMARPGFRQIPAVQHLDMHEIKSSLILQPGPAALTDGLTELQKIVERWAGVVND